MAHIRNYAGRNFRKRRRKESLTVQKRSALMSRIRSRGTAFERLFFSSLKAHRLPFRSHPTNIFGKPDLILLNAKVCVFLDSDFWHGWQYPRWRHLLKNNFWREKIERNRARDKKVTRALCNKGWKVVRIWEHELKESHEEAIKRHFKRFI